MAIAGHTQETDSRRTAMLRTAFCLVVREAIDAPDTIEIMANPDGSVWIERAGVGIVMSEHTLEASDRERVIRLVASGVGEAASRASPIVSAELPGSGERFEGLLPPVSTAPCFSIRKPATTPFDLDDYVGQGALRRHFARRSGSLSHRMPTFWWRAGPHPARRPLRTRCSPNRLLPMTGLSFLKTRASFDALRPILSNCAPIAAVSACSIWCAPLCG